MPLNAFAPNKKPRIHYEFGAFDFVVSYFAEEEGNEPTPIYLKFNNLYLSLAVTLLLEFGSTNRCDVQNSSRFTKKYVFAKNRLTSEFALMIKTIGPYSVFGHSVGQTAKNVKTGFSRRSSGRII